MSIPGINQNITSKISDANLIIINFPCIFFHRIIVLKYSYLLFPNTSLSNSNCHKRACESNFYRYMNILGNCCLWMSEFAFCLSVLIKVFRPVKPNTHFS